MSNEVRRYAIALSLAAALAGSAQLVAAQGRHLETARPTPQIAACDILVDVNTGETFHVEKTAASPLSAGSSLTLSGTTYTVTGFGPVYHLEDGTVLQASGTGSNTLQGQQWTEIYPDAVGPRGVDRGIRSGRDQQLPHFGNRNDPHHGVAPRLPVPPPARIQPRSEAGGGQQQRRAPRSSVLDALAIDHE